MWLWEVYTNIHLARGGDEIEIEEIEIGYIGYGVKILQVKYKKI